MPQATGFPPDGAAKSPGGDFALVAEGSLRAAEACLVRLADESERAAAGRNWPPSPPNCDRFSPASE